MQKFFFCLQDLLLDRILRYCRQIVLGCVIKVHIFFSETTEQNSYTSYLYWVSCVCSNGGATYIIIEIIVKDNINIAYLMPNL